MKILKAFWTDVNEITFVLSKDCQFIPKIEFENTTIKPVSIHRTDIGKYAQQSSYYVKDGTVHFLISAKTFPDVEVQKSYYLCGDFNEWGKAIGNPLWKLRAIEGDENFCFSIDVAEVAFGQRKNLHQFKIACIDGSWLEPSREVENLAPDGKNNFNLWLNFSRTGRHSFVVKTSQMCQMGEPIEIYMPEFNSRATVDESVLLSNIYTSSQMGVSLENGKSVFRLFAPRAEKVSVVYFRQGENQHHILDAETSDNVVWTARANENLEGAFYYYNVGGENFGNTTSFDYKKIVADPYANAMLNSQGICIVKYNSSLPKNLDNFTPPSWHNLVVVEAHLRDVLANAQANLSDDERLGFSGLTRWLSSPDCYLRKCGANCVELQPIQEFTYQKKSDYEWGYMPVNWFAPSSAYASNPEQATQNFEFAELVSAFHKAGLAVILDVVYNHYGEPNFLELIDKQYYLTCTFDGNLTNYSGCGNDFNTSTPMGRRIIVDSLKKLVLNYGVDGFRFDLAELLGVEMLVEIERELKKIKPSIILIAEPWSFRGHIANRLKNTGFASWNDGFREFVLQYAKGFGNFEGFKYFMRGSLGGVASFPAQSVNYVESHDDMCLFDRITTLHDYPSVEDLRRYKIAYAFTLLAHGIPMLAEGFDLARTKYGKNNTYKDGDANKLDYFRGVRFSGVCNWLRSLVKFRLSPSGKALRRDGCDSADFFKFYKSAKLESAGAVMFNHSCVDSSTRIFVAFNPTSETAEFFVGADLQNFVLIADIENFNEAGLLSEACIDARGILKMPPLTMLLYKAL